MKEFIKTRGSKMHSSYCEDAGYDSLLRETTTNYERKMLYNQAKTSQTPRAFSSNPFAKIQIFHSFNLPASNEEASERTFGEMVKVIAAGQNSNKSKRIKSSALYTPLPIARQTLIKEAAITKEIKLQHIKLTLKQKHERSKELIESLMKENQRMREEIKKSINPKLQELRIKESHPLTLYEQIQQEEEPTVTQPTFRDLELQNIHSENKESHTYLDVPSNAAWDLLSDISEVHSERGGRVKLKKTRSKPRKLKTSISKLMKKTQIGPVQRYQKIQERLKKIRDEIEYLSQKKIDYKQQLRDNAQRIVEEEALKKEFKSEIERITSMQLEHYYNLLRIGRDGRLEGLAWIVKTIWRLGGAVDKEHIPNFIDEKGKSYILEQAKVGLMIENMEGSGGGYSGDNESGDAYRRAKRKAKLREMNENRVQIEALEKRMEKYKKEEEVRIQRQITHFDYAIKYGATHEAVRLALFGEKAIEGN